MFSEDLNDFLEALECLYVFDNLGGRIQFREQYPHTALYIFPAELIHFDEIGTKDTDFRFKLEQEADQNLSQLVADITAIKDTEASDQTLEPKEIEEFITTIGRDISLHIFDIAIVDRFAPAPKEPEPKPEPTAKPTPPTPEPEPEPDIQPISTPTPPNAKLITAQPIDLGKKRTLFHAPPPKSGISYQEILKAAEEETGQPQKNHYKRLFNIVANVTA